MLGDRSWDLIVDTWSGAPAVAGVAAGSHRPRRQVIAPGRPGRPLQYVDARDLASWMLSGLSSGVSGGVDVASPSGHATTQELLTACTAATGLVCRPVQETVNDTWRWLQQEGMPAQRPDRDAHGLPAELERLLLTAR